MWIALFFTMFETNSMIPLHKPHTRNQETTPFISYNDLYEMGMNYKKFRATDVEMEVARKSLEPLSKDLLKAHASGIANGFKELESLFLVLWYILRSSNGTGNLGQKDPFVSVILEDFEKKKELGRLLKMDFDDFGMLKSYEKLFNGMTSENFEESEKQKATYVEGVEILKKRQYEESKADYLWFITSMAYPKLEKGIFGYVFDILKKILNITTFTKKEHNYFSKQGDCYSNMCKLFVPYENYDLVDGYTTTFIGEKCKRGAQLMTYGIYDIVTNGEGSTYLMAGSYYGPVES
jgi:hypothetical protein